MAESSALITNCYYYLCTPQIYWFSVAEMASEPYQMDFDTFSKGKGREGENERSRSSANMPKNQK